MFILPTIASTLILAEGIPKKITPNNLFDVSYSIDSLFVPVDGKKNLITQEREGERKTFEIPVLPSDREGEIIPTEIDSIEAIEVIADTQQYDEVRGVITAKGNVVMRFGESVLTGDLLQVNLNSRIAVAQGNVILTRGEQVLKGERFEYYLVQDRGIIKNASGQIDRANLDRDLSGKLPQANTVSDLGINDRLFVNQPVTDVSLKDKIELSIGSNRDIAILQGDNLEERQGTISKVRFEADIIEFELNDWEATNLRLTNDPFSPPELELRADSASFKQSDSLANQLMTKKSRLVIDDRFSLPLFKNAFLFSSRPDSPGLIRVGFDGEERGGLYIERSFKIIDRDRTVWKITPQFFIQRALFPELFNLNDEDEGGFINSSTFGLKSRFDTLLSRRNSINAKFSLTSFDVNDLEDDIRAKLAATQLIGSLNNPHRLSLEYNFRERLFNGSLGFKTVYSSVGAVLTSPNISLGKTGINFKYQGSIQNIDGDTDLEELLSSNRVNNRVNLTRYQGAIFLGKSFSLWRGKGLPATKDKGLRYTPVPIIPYLQLNTGFSGVSSLYSNGDGQNSLRGSIGIQGQLGNFSRSFLDYTGFNITYSVGNSAEESPFLFDRDVDNETLALGITQQLYGAIKLGFQTSFNLNDGDEISTDYIIEYSRRTHNISIRYNPVLEIGSFSFRINDFNWRGDSEPFDRNDITPIEQGISR